MSVELINRITIKKDGVYLSTHSSNDSSPFRSFRCDGLSDVYLAEGQKGLDREVIRMLYGYAELRGAHKSLKRYRYAKSTLEARAIYTRYNDLINDRYEDLDEADKKSIWRKPTEKAKGYLAYKRKMLDKMYTEIAEGCERYEEGAEIKWE